MNYSTRKAMERLFKESAADVFDPFNFRMPGMFGDLKVVESPDMPRYTLPPEVMPGVPWPPGFRDEINRWSRATLGTTNMLPPGGAYMIGGTIAVMRPSDVVKLSCL